MPGKNIRVLAGIRCIAYTIAPALESGVFDAVIVSTDSEEIAAIARHYGAEVPFLRPAEFAGDTSPDIEWVEHTLTTLARGPARSTASASCGRPARSAAPETHAPRVGAFSRGPRRRFAARGGEVHAASGQDVGRRAADRLLPLLPFGPAEQPWHSSQYQALPPVYVQNASLEIAWSRVVFEGRTIAGDIDRAVLHRRAEGFDINNRYDWWSREHLLRRRRRRSCLTCPQPPYVPQSEPDAS